MPAAALASETDLGIDTRALEDSVPEMPEGILRGLSPGKASLNQGINNLIGTAAERSGGIFKESLGSLLLVLTVVVLCSMAGTLFERGEGKPEIVIFAGVLAIAAISFGGFNTMLRQTQTAVANINGFISTLLPTLTAASAAMGQPTAAVVRQTATLFFSDLLINIIDRLLLPALCAYIALITVNAITPRGLLSRLADMIKWLVKGVLTVSLISFIFYLVISGSIAGSTDIIAIKSAKLALSGTVPVVGGIIAEASETLLVSAGIIKNAIGVFGLFAVLGVLLVPFLQLGARYLMYKVTAALSSALADEKLCKYIDGLSGVFGMLLGMVGASAFLCVIAVVNCLLISGAA
jgi:stage III sporulation protein AE